MLAPRKKARGKSSRRPSLPKSLTVPGAVEIDQAASLDDRPLVLRHILAVQGQFRRLPVFQHISCDVGQVAVQGGADAGDIDIVPHLKAARLPLQMEGQHAPVHHIGAVTLGGVVLGDIG